MAKITLCAITMILLASCGKQAQEAKGANSIQNSTPQESSQLTTSGQQRAVMLFNQTTYLTLPNLIEVSSGTLNQESARLYIDQNDDVYAYFCEYRQEKSVNALVFYKCFTPYMSETTHYAGYTEVILKGNSVQLELTGESIDSDLSINVNLASPAL